MVKWVNEWIDRWLNEWTNEWKYMKELGWMKSETDNITFNTSVGLQIADATEPPITPAKTFRYSFSSGEKTTTIEWEKVHWIIIIALWKYCLPFGSLTNILFKAW